MRLFVAMDINDDVRKAVAKLQRDIEDRLKNQSGLKWVNPELMHLTLKFLGETDESRLDEISDTIEIACAGKEAFQFCLSAVGTFGRPVSVLWLGSSPPHLLAQSSDKENSNRNSYAGKMDISKADVNRCGGKKQNADLVKLAGDIEQALEELGFEREQRDFNAHLTLARIKNPGIDKILRQVLNDFPKINLPIVSVDSVCLYKSQLTSDGPVYTLLRKIELNPVRHP